MVASIGIILLLTACGEHNEASGDGQEINPINDSFFIEKHEEYADRLQEEQGFSKGEADEEAFRTQLNEVAVINRAIDVGIEVSEKEALQVAHEMRDLLEEGEADNAEEALNNTQEIINRLGITEEEYWNDYVINSYIQMLMRERLIEYERNENPGMSWNERQKDIIEDFKSRESRQINKFKKEIGMS